MLKRRSTWLGGTGGLLLVLSLSGVVAGATMFTAVAEPAPEVVEPGDPADTTATFEDLNGDGIDDDCQEDEVADEAAATAAEAAVDTDGDGVISTTEAAHSDRTGGTNCNHGGYVSWIAHQDACTVEPSEPVADVPADGDVLLVVSEPNDTDSDSTDPEAVVCDEEADEALTDAEAAKQDKDAARAARAARKAERALAREAAKAERALARETKRSERAAAHDARKAERQAARAAKQAERQAAKAARQNKGH